MKWLHRTLEQFHIHAHHVKENFEKAQQKLANSLKFSGKALSTQLCTKSNIMFENNISSFLILVAIMKVILSLEIIEQNHELHFPTDSI